MENAMLGSSAPQPNGASNTDSATENVASVGGKFTRADLIAMRAAIDAEIQQLPPEQPPVAVIAAPETPPPQPGNQPADTSPEAATPSSVELAPEQPVEAQRGRVR